MAIAPQLLTKSVAESRRFTMIFSASIPASESIISVTSVVSDPVDASLLITSIDFTSDRVSFDIAAGTEFTRYAINVTVTTDLGNIYQSSGALYVTPVASAQNPVPPSLAAPVYLYSTRKEIESIFGAIAVVLRIGDNSQELDAGTNESVLIFDAIVEATDTINGYITDYSWEDMAKSTWVRRRATYLCCCALSMRRGNPKQYAPKCEEIMGELDLVRLGILVVPGLATRANLAPSLSNIIVDDRWRDAKLRVSRYTSSGGSYGEQDQDLVYWWYGL